MKSLLIMLTWGGVPKNLICSTSKARYKLYVFRQNVYIFNIFVYFNNIAPLNISKNVKNYEIHYAMRAKK